MAHDERNRIDLDPPNYTSDTIYNTDINQSDKTLKPTKEGENSSLDRSDTVCEASVAEAGEFGVKEEGGGYRNLGRWDTALIFITNEVGLGVLSLPTALQNLGLIPGIIAIVGLGVLTTYTAYVLLQFYRKYPHVVNIVDCGRIIGGKPIEILVAAAFIINLCLTCASAGLTMSIALNTMSDSALCTVGFVAFPIIGCWLLCMPRKFSFIAKMGIPCTISIVAAVMIVMIALGVAGPQGAPPGFDKKIILVNYDVSFTAAFTSCLNIAFAYAGNQGFVTVMAEMRDPSRDFVPALYYLQGFAITIYTVVGAVIYSLAGEYTTSPALGSATVTSAKIAYGIVFPCLLGTGLVFGHTAIKYLFVVTMRKMNAAHEITSNSKRSWIVWVVLGTIFWIVAFILANAIPVFSSILSVSSAIFVSWFTFGLSGVIWLHLNWTKQFMNKKKMALAALNWGIIGIALLMNSAGMYASIDQLLSVFNDPDEAINGPFTCASNSLF